MSKIQRGIYIQIYRIGLYMVDSHESGAFEPYFFLIFKINTSFAFVNVNFLYRILYTLYL